MTFGLEKWSMPYMYRPETDTGLLLAKTTSKLTKRHVWLCTPEM